MNDLHGKLVHPSEDDTHMMGKTRHRKVANPSKPCWYCAWGKGKQGKINKDPVEKSKITIECLFIDIISSETKSTYGKWNWLLLMDYCTVNVRSFFFKRKIDYIIELFTLINISKWNITIQWKLSKAIIQLRIELLRSCASIKDWI